MTLYFTYKFRDTIKSFTLFITDKISKLNQYGPPFEKSISINFSKT